MRPDRYCEIVGFDTPIAFAISVLLLPDCSISRLIFSDILMSNEFSIYLLY